MHCSSFFLVSYPFFLKEKCHILKTCSLAYDWLMSHRSIQKSEKTTSIMIFFLLVISISKTIPVFTVYGIIIFFKKTKNLQRTLSDNNVILIFGSFVNLYYILNYLV